MLSMSLTAILLKMPGHIFCIGVAHSGLPCTLSRKRPDGPISLRGPCPYCFRNKEEVVISLLGRMCCMFACRKNSGGVGYFRLGWVTSVYFRREFRASRGGLLRGGLLLGYLHHGLRWVTSVDAHVMIPSHDTQERQNPYM